MLLNSFDLFLIPNKQHVNKPVILPSCPFDWSTLIKQTICSLNFVDSILFNSQGINCFIMTKCTNMILETLFKWMMFCLRHYCCTLTYIKKHCCLHCLIWLEITYRNKIANTKAYSVILKEGTASQTKNKHVLCAISKLSGWHHVLKNNIIILRL